MSSKLKSGLFLTLFVLLFSLLINNSFIYAIPQCNNCSCSGNGYCSGCKFALTAPGGTVGFYVSVPAAGSYYNYCEKNPNSTNPCTTSSLSCFNIPAGTFVNIYADSACSILIGQGTGPLTVYVQGCNP